MSNSFKELYKDEKPGEEVKKKVMASQRQIRHIASFFELFLGNFFRSITGFIEATENKSEKQLRKPEKKSNHD